MNEHSFIFHGTEGEIKLFFAEVRHEGQMFPQKGVYFSILRGDFFLDAIRPLPCAAAVAEGDRGGEVAASFGSRQRRRSFKEKAYDGLVEALALRLLDSHEDIADLSTARQRARECIARSCAEGSPAPPPELIHWKQEAVG
jgi:hypothetical protein